MKRLKEKCQKNSVPEFGKNLNLSKSKYEKASSHRKRNFGSPAVFNNLNLIQCSNEEGARKQGKVSGILPEMITNFGQSGCSSAVSADLIGQERLLGLLSGLPNCRQLGRLWQASFGQMIS